LRRRFNYLKNIVGGKMKFKSLKLAAVVLSVCFLSFFAAGNALAAYAESGAAIYGLTVSGPGLVLASSGFSFGTAADIDGVPAIPVVTPVSSSSSSSTSFGISNANANVWAIAPTPGLVMTGFAAAGQIHGGTANASSTGSMSWNWTVTTAGVYTIAVSSICGPVV